GEIFDLDSVLLATVGVLHLATEREERQIEKSDAAQERRHFIFGSKCNHSLSRSSSGWNRQRRGQFCLVCIGRSLGRAGCAAVQLALSLDPATARFQIGRASCRKECRDRRWG